MISIIRFYLDDLLGRGSNSLILWLAIIGAIFVLATSSLTWWIGASPYDDFFSLVWDLAMRTIIPWEIKSDEGSDSYLVIALIVTLFGIFVLSILIGLLSSIIQSRVQAIGRGAQRFPFKDHLVIVGWSDRIIAILDELIKANESNKKNRVLIVSSVASEELSERISSNINDSKTTSIFCRCRDPLLHSTLENVNLEYAKKVLILGDEGSNIESTRLKIFLSLKKYIDSKTTEVGSSPELLINVENKNEEKTILMASENFAVPINVNDIPAKLIVETVTQPHLPAIYEEIFSFDGNELYISETIREMKVRANTFEEVIEWFPEAVIFGLFSIEKGVNLLPGQKHPVSESDQLILLAEDDSMINPVDPSLRKKARKSNLPPSLDNILQAPSEGVPVIKKIMIVGLSSQQMYIVERLSMLLPYLKCITLLMPETNAAKSVSSKISNKKLDKVECFIENIDDLDILASKDFSEYDVIIVSQTDASLCTKGEEDVTSLRVLIFLRSLVKNYKKPPRIIVEMNSGQNKDISSGDMDSDYVVSESIGSKVFAQYVENPHLKQVIDNLISSDSTRIRLLDVEKGHRLITNVDFESIAKSFLTENFILLGWKYSVGDQFRSVLNPGMYSRLPEKAGNVSMIVLERFNN